METRANHLLIGIFVIAALLAGAASFLWLAKATLDDSFADYDVIFTESVTGLSRGSAVYFSGVNVGQVRDITLNKDNPAEVVARIRLDSRTPVRIDTRAKLEYQGITGIGTIGLSGGSGAPLTRDGEVPQIRADKSDLAKLFEGSSDIMTGANDVFLRVRALLDDQNLQLVASTLAHIEATAQTLADERESLVRSMRNLEAITDELKGSSVQVGAASERVGLLVEDVRGWMREELPELTAETNRTLNQLTQLAAEGQALVAENRAGISTFTGTGLAELTQATSELRSLLRSLERIAEAVETDPAGFILNRSEPKPYAPDSKR